MKKILTLNAISDVIFDYLQKDEYEVSDSAAAPEAILVRSAKLHDYEMGGELLCIGRAGAGVNNIPVDKCSEQGVVVFNTPGANANGVKELVICGLLMSGRKIAESIEWAKTLKGKGDEVGKLVEKGKKNFAGPEVMGKKLGIIGMGAIGGSVANVAISLGMEVTGYDPFMSVDAALSLTRAVNMTKSIDEIFKNSDYITIHVPLNDQTKNLIGKDSIPKLKDGVKILNFSRGGLVDSEEMLKALESGKIAKYITDFPSDDVLCNDKVIALPHLGASTPEAEDNCAAMAARQVDDYIKNGNIANSVNFPNCFQPRSGNLRLSFIHKNVTNMVGQITGILAAEDHNISNMMNASRGEYAYTLIDVEDVPSDDCVKKLTDIEGMLKVRVIE
jgi:D-3-phosphoglycerate dehydrogenase